MMNENNSKSGSIRIGFDLVGDHWTVMIFREMFMGATQWSEFEQRLEIPPSTLNKRLKTLEAAGCISKWKKDGSRESSYALTQMGRDLFPFQMASREWQLKWDSRPGKFVTPWVHDCGQPLRCRSVCSECGLEIDSGDISFRDGGTPEADYVRPPSRHQRSSGSIARDARAKSSTPPKVNEVIGNHRSSVIMGAILRGLNRFDDILNYTRLPPATLSDRLKKLQLLDFVHTRLYQRRPDRHEYFASEAGMDLVGLSLELLRWSDHWLRGFGAGATQAYHSPCGKVIESRLRCVHCDKDVRFENCHLDPGGGVV